jgi:hypothetical protein
MTGVELITSAARVHETLLEDDTIDHLQDYLRRYEAGTVENYAIERVITGDLFAGRITMAPLTLGIHMSMCSKQL